MRQADIELGKSIEESAKDQVGRRDCSIKWISQQVVQVVTCQPLRPNNIERVEKDRDCQRVNTFEDRQKRKIGQLFSPNVGAKIDTAAAEFFHCPIDFVNCSLGVLHGERGQSDKPVGMCTGGFCHGVVD